MGVILTGQIEMKGNYEPSVKNIAWMLLFDIIAEAGVVGGVVGGTLWLYLH